MDLLKNFGHTMTEASCVRLSANRETPAEPYNGLDSDTSSDDEYDLELNVKFIVLKIFQLHVTSQSAIGGHNEENFLGTNASNLICVTQNIGKFRDDHAKIINILHDNDEAISMMTELTGLSTNPTSNNSGSHSSNYILHASNTLPRQSVIKV